MRGTALVVLLCVFAAVAAHVLSEDARARSRATEEFGLPGSCEFAPAATESGPCSASMNSDAAGSGDDATTQP